ncbi:MAG: response regulator [Terriglobia bacterium]|jgi:CheY-like chemotaxis protein
MKILLVDDDPEVCRLVKTMVEPLGVEVRTSSDSQEAALILANEKFDGIMLDVAMPNLDGFELTRRIRSTPPNQQAPIIIITGFDDVDTIRHAFEAGATFFIGKPFSREKIYAIFRTARGAMLAERRRSASLPYRTSVTCAREGERFNATSISIGEVGMALESSGTAQVDDVLALEFNMPDVKKPIKVTGRIRVKEAAGRTSIEFINPSDAGRDVIREYIHDKVTE